MTLLGDRDFIGGIQSDGFGASGRGRLVSQTQTREFDHIRGAEIQVPQAMTGKRSSDGIRSG